MKKLACALLVVAGAGFSLSAVAMEALDKAFAVEFVQEAPQAQEVWQPKPIKVLDGADYAPAPDAAGIWQPKPIKVLHAAPAHVRQAGEIWQPKPIKVRYADKKPPKPKIWQPKPIKV